MKGWKTYTAAVVVAACAVLRYYGYNEIAQALLIFAGALGLVGVGHKLDKLSR